MKDNLVKRKWNGCTKCCFLARRRASNIYFFDCRLACLIWNVVSISFDIQPPSSITNLFGPWLRGFSLKLRGQVLIGAAALCWALWLSKTDVVFQRSVPNSFALVIFRGTFWIRSWLILFKKEERNSLKKECQSLEIIVMEVLNKAGWNLPRRIKC